MRRFFKPFLCHTTYINQLAVHFLVNEFGLIHRVFCYDYPTLLKIGEYFSKNYAFETLTEHWKKNGFEQEFSKDEGKSDEDDEKLLDSQCPVYHDSVALYKIHKWFVQEYMKLYYPKGIESVKKDKCLLKCIYQLHGLLGIKRDDVESNYDKLIDEFTNILFVATGKHEFVGNFVEYKIRPDIYCGKVRKSHHIADMEAYAQLISLGAFTGPRTPGLIGDFTHLLLQDDKKDETKDLFVHWQDKLKVLRDDINNKNKNGTRKMPFNAFNPEYLECSVSI